MLTELGWSQVEVQRCSLSSEGPRLRPSSAQCAQTLAIEVQQCPLRAELGEELGEDGKAEVNMEVEAEVVEEKEAEEEKEEEPEQL